MKNKFYIAPDTKLDWTVSVPVRPEYDSLYGRVGYVEKLRIYAHIVGNNGQFYSLELPHHI